MGFLESLRDRELRGLYKARRILESVDLRLAKGSGQDVDEDLDRVKDILFADLQRLSPHSRDFADALTLLSMVQLKVGNIDEAIRAADRALELQADHGPSLYTLGFAMSGLGEYAAAKEALSERPDVDLEMGEQVDLHPKG